MADGTSTARDLEADMQQLPDRRAAADAEAAKQPAALTATQATITQAKTTLASIREGYDKSCYVDIDEADKQLEAKRAELTAIQKEAQGIVGIKSVTAVTQTEQQTQRFTQATEDINALAASVSSRLTELETIKATMAEQIEGIKDDLDLTHKYAFDEYRDYVEDDVRAAIETAIEKLLAFEKAEVNVKAPKQPRYLVIRDNIHSLTQAVTAATELAHNQKVEKDQLLAEREQLITAARTADDSHDRYVDANRGDIDDASERVAAQLEPPEIDIEVMDRTVLQQQVATLREFTRQVTAAHQEAEGDVAREEEKRAEERREALAREQARQEAMRAQARLEQASRTSTIGGSFGSSPSQSSTVGGPW